MTYLSLLWQYIKVNVYRTYWTMWGMRKARNKAEDKINRIRQAGYLPYFYDDIAKELDSYDN